MSCIRPWNDERSRRTRTVTSPFQRTRSKGGKEAKGITTGFLKPLIKKIAKDARRKLGSGPIKFLHDRAPAYVGLVSAVEKEGFDSGFDEIALAAGKAPDMSHCDAALCPFMEREVELAGAQTADEIRAAVRAAWKKVTPAMCVAISHRVRANMQKVINLKGGNFYDE